MLQSTGLQRVRRDFATEQQQMHQVQFSSVPGDPIEDAAWNMTSKARLFDGEIDIEFSQSLNDLGDAESTTFTVTATIDENFQAVGFIEI